MITAASSYDVFLSHSSKDKAMARQISSQLRQRGIRVWFDEWSISPGDSIPEAIELGLAQSRVLVLLMSRAAFDSEWVSLERQAALFRDPANRARRFVPIRLDNLEHANIPMMLRQYKYIDCSNESSAGIEQLFQLCRPTPLESDIKAFLPPEPLHSTTTNKSPTLNRREREEKQMLLDRLGDQFEICECLHHDRHNSIFRARDRVLKREVAVKLPNLPSSGAEIVAGAFYEKMRAVSIVNHRNIVPIFGGFRIDNLPILVMGFISGVSIEELVEKTGAQPFQKIRKLLLEVGSALEYSHRRGAVRHRLRPCDILLDEDGTPIVTPMTFVDHTFQPTVDRENKSDLMRVNYEAPESLFPAFIAPDKSDQYSLGMIAYEMLVGEKLFDSSNYTRILQEKRKWRVPADPIKLGRKCPKSLWKIICTMLDNDPDHRFESFSALVQEVQKLDDEKLGLKRVSNSKIGTAIKRVTESINRCRVHQLFFQDFYRELISKEEVRKLFDRRKVNAVSSKKQHWLLRESLELLIAYADEDSTEDGMHVLKRIVQTHAHYQVAPEMYDHFQKTLLDVVRRYEIERYETGDFETMDKSINVLLSAWSDVLRPGIEYLKKSG